MEQFNQETLGTTIVESEHLAQNGAGDFETVSNKPEDAQIKQAVKLRIEAETEIAPREAVEINLRSMLQAGVHFGHQTSRWNPKMAPYIYGTRNGIHIINLPKTLQAWTTARKKIVDVVADGGSVLFVGTKKQAQDAVMEEARRSGSFYVSRRWLGGMMTNFQTIRKSINRMNKLEEILADEEKAQKEGTGTKFTKKERLMMSREQEKLYFSLGGIREMYAPPQLLFVVDIRREDIAIKEAQRLDIPVVALVDTNCDPSCVSDPIPSNDDGTRAVRLFCAAVADAIMEGKKIGAQRKERVAQTVSSSTRRRGQQQESSASVADADVVPAAAAQPEIEQTSPDAAPAQVENAAQAEAQEEKSAGGGDIQG